MIKIRIADTWQALNIANRYKLKGMGVESKRKGKCWYIYVKLPALLRNQAI